LLQGHQKAWRRLQHYCKGIRRLGDGLQQSQMPHFITWQLKLQQYKSENYEKRNH
jgi:hypothetical protein